MEISFITKFDGLAGDMDSWVRFATEKNVENLRLNLPFDWSKPLESPEYWLPRCIYSCSSIIKLWISGCNLGIGIPKKLQWDKLKSLYLQGSWFSEDVINRIVSSSPCLEIFHLRIRRSHHDLNIESSSLKTLSVVKYNVFGRAYDPSTYTMLTICAPKLESLHLWGNAYSQCNLLMNASSLTHATLCFYEKWYASLQETLMQILPTIQHIEDVTLSPCAFKMLGVMQAKYSFPPFLNVKKLKLHGGPITPKEIAGVVQMFPEVETLVIDWKLDEWYPFFLKNLWSTTTTYKDSDAKPCLKQLRTVEIIPPYSNYDPFAFQIIFSFLREHAIMLQKTVISWKNCSNYKINDQTSICS